MSGRPAFALDATACSGCKACQVACKDRHALAVGVLWRRVYEVAGGGWRRSGGAWMNDVFAYNVSLSCNHCDEPICVEVCPTGAMHLRADGLVLVDERRCVGCRYCAFACPYGAPQYDAARGRMTKCTFCVEDLEAGLPPACVASCPTRALSVVGRDEVRAPSVEAFPLPDPAWTEPALAVAHHRDAVRAAGLSSVANVEEVRP